MRYLRREVYGGKCAQHGRGSFKCNRAGRERHLGPRRKERDRDEEKAVQFQAPCMRSPDRRIFYTVAAETRKCPLEIIPSSRVPRGPVNQNVWLTALSNNCTLVKICDFWNEGGREKGQRRKECDRKGRERKGDRGVGQRCKE